MNHQKGTNKENARRTRRKAALKAAIVVYGEKHIAVDTTFLDISASGARIRIPTGVSFPDTFTVIDPAEKIAYLCAVIYFDASLCGVKFMNRHPLASLPPSLDFLRKYLD